MDYKLDLALHLFPIFLLITIILIGYSAIASKYLRKYKKKLRKFLSAHADYEIAINRIKRKEPFVISITRLLKPYIAARLAITTLSLTLLCIAIILESTKSTFHDFLSLFCLMIGLQLLIWNFTYTKQ